MFNYPNYILLIILNLLLFVVSLYHLVQREEKVAGLMNPKIKGKGKLTNWLKLVENIHENPPVPTQYHPMHAKKVFVQFFSLSFQLPFSVSTTQ